jgi:hypothetical protein
MDDDEPKTLQEFARKHDSLFRLAEATKFGWTEDMRHYRMSTGEVEMLYEGVYRFAAGTDSWRSRALAAAWAGGEVCGLSHATAAKIYALPGARREPIEILCRRWERAHHENLHVHEFSGLLESDITQASKLPVVVCELALLQIAGYKWATIDHVETALYAARRQGHVSNSSVQEYLYRRARRGRPGVRKLRAALERSYAHTKPTDSNKETALLQALRRHGFPEPALQYVVRDAHGKFVARVDARLAGWPILLEYDSRQYHSDEVDDRRDGRRRAWAAKYGFWLIPVRYDDLKRGGEEMADAIRGALQTLKIDPNRR